MSSEEILTKTIEKAIANGWKESIYYDEYHPIETIFNHAFAKALWKDAKTPKSHEAKDEEKDQGIFGEVLGLYSGGGYEGYGDVCKFNGEPWQYHLQQMVIADDPIQYLGENI